MNDNTTLVTVNPTPPNAERIAALRKRAENSVGQIWQPIAGDVLVGSIVGSETTTHPIYGQQRLMLIQTEFGAIFKVWLSRWLVENLRAQDAQQHDLIALTFNGKHKTANGKEYNSYTLVVEKN